MDNQHDFDDIEKIKAQFKEYLQRYSKMFRLIPLALIVLIGIPSTFYTVEPDEEGCCC